MSTGQSTRRIRYGQIRQYPGYRFGSDGSIWTQWHGGVKTPTWEWQQLKPFRTPFGHLRTCIKISGKDKVVGVHRMICWAFRGPAPKGKTCRHLDGNPANNRIGNLRWGTPRDKVHDAMRQGTHPSGTQSGAAKLTEGQVREIRRLEAAGGRSRWSIAAQFNVAHGTVNRIVNGLGWHRVR